MKPVIVGVAGLQVAPDEAVLLREHHPAGVILFARNIDTPGQLAALTLELARLLPPLASIMIDQEGGRVARLRPPHWLRHPPAAAYGTLFATNPPAAIRAAWLSGALIGLEAAAVGIDVVTAPVLDRAVPGADAIIGNRAFAADPAVVGELAAGFAAGVLAAGVQPVGKHAPGHGRATVDSHATLPQVDVTQDDDLAPFIRCAHLPWMMTAHIVYAADDPARPATLSPTVISEVIRGRIGFAGVLVSDDLGMGALSGPPAERARAALEAGCDLALNCSGMLDETAAVLEACPDAPEPTLMRLRAATFLAERSRQALDASALLAERDGLLAEAPRL